MPILESADTVEDTSQAYKDNIKRWSFWGSAYEGDQAFIDLVVTQHPRESPGNFQERKSEAEVFNYSETVVNTYATFVGMAEPDRDLGALATDPSFLQFKNDTDLYGTDYDVFWDNSSEMVGVYGFSGVLVDKPPEPETGGQRSKKQELDSRIYPYYSLFTPENILDWIWTRNPATARPELTFLKLRENEDSVLVWAQTEWERWTRSDDDEGESWVIAPGDSGLNPLGEIPFVWYVNYAVPRQPYLGLSDIRAVSRLQAALTRDLSNGGEVIKYAAFPMLLEPWTTTNTEPSEEDDVSGVTAIKTYDPENPAAKPEWLEAAVGEPIDAILKWDERKIEEIYRTAALSTFYGRHAEARSGVALRLEFRQLKAIVNGKSSSLDDAETQALRLWRKWQGLAVDDKLTIHRPDAADIDELKLQLENLVVAKTSVRSETFKRAVEKRVVRLALANATDEELAAIEGEIDSQQPPGVSDFIGDGEE